MKFIEDHIAEIGKEACGIGRRDQQGKLLRRGQQNVRRGELLALALVRRRIARARFHADGQPHFANRFPEVAFDIDGKRLERGNVKRVYAAMRFPRFSFGTRRDIGQ